jgi:cell division septum initiation protein DivIVA
MEKTMKSCIYFFVLLLTLTISCKEQDKLPDEAIMRDLLAKNADSLAYLLEETINPNLLSANDKINYTWWLANTHSKQHRSLINDSLIYGVLDYHKQNNSPLLFSTYLLAAEQAKSEKKISKEEALLNEALSLAKERRDTAMVINLCSKLEYLYEDYKDNEKINNLIRVVKEYTYPNTNTYLTLVKLYSRSNELDSLAKYSSLGIKAAITENNPVAEYQMTRTYVEYLNQSGQSKKALNLLREIEYKMPIDRGIIGIEIKFNYITTWIALAEYDSARVYVDYFNPVLEEAKLTSSTEIPVIKSILDIFKVIIRSKQGGVFSAHDLASVNQIVDDSRASLQIERERVYAQNKLQKDKLNLEIEKGKLQQHLLWGAIVLIVIITALIFIYQRKLLQKERSLQKTKEELRTKTMQIAENESIISQNEQLIDSLKTQAGESDDIKQELEQLVSENEKIKERNKQLQSDVQSFSESALKKDKDLNFLEDLSIQNAKLMEHDQFLTTQLIKKTKILDDLNKNPRYIEESQWHEIIYTADQLFNSFSVRLHIDIPALTEEDIRYCCLFKLRLSNSSISSLMGISPSSVTKRKQRIKEKINQYKSLESDKEKSLEIYLWNYN